MCPSPKRALVLGIAGSARRGGNSDRLLDEALAGAEEEGARAERIVPAELAVEPCRACDACRARGRCIIDDVADEVHTKLEGADALVLSSPIYFGGIPARLKALIDRAQVRHWAWLERGSPHPVRPALLLVVGGRTKGQNAFAGVRTVAASWFAVLGFRIWEARGYPALDGPDATSTREEILTEARSLGRGLAQQAFRGRRTQ